MVYSNYYLRCPVVNVDPTITRIKYLSHIIYLHHRIISTQTIYSNHSELLLRFML